MSATIAGAGSGPLLECREVTKRFGALVAVNQLSFELRRGDVLGIGGPNGAGKTTLFDVISGFVPADAGSVLLEGRSLQGLRPHAVCHRGVARTFQLNAAFNSLTVYENVLAAAHFGRRRLPLSSISFHAAAVETAEEMLAFTGLENRRKQLAGSLPVIDRKRVMIAAALATQPRCLLMDEPVGGLSPKEIEEMMALVTAIRKRDIAIILIEHVMRFLMSLSTRILVMHHGECLFLGEPAAMAQDERVAEVYLGKRASQRIRDYIAVRSRTP
jgi:branched-chain amino acid transport system ATP-binding protein